jgi:hypothetical protein
MDSSSFDELVIELIQELGDNDERRKLLEQLLPTIQELPNVPSVIATKLGKSQSSMTEQSSIDNERKEKLKEEELTRLLRYKQRIVQGITEVRLKTEFVVRSIIGQKPKDTMEAILQEIREQKCWSRIRFLLDGRQVGQLARSLEEIVERFAIGNYQLELRTLLIELPVYLEARREGDLMKEFLRIVNEKKIPYLSPIECKALRIWLEIEEGSKQLNEAFLIAENYLAGDDFNKVPELPAWNEGTTVIWDGEFTFEQ